MSYYYLAHYQAQTLNSVHANLSCHIYNVLCRISCSCILVFYMCQTPQAVHSIKEHILSQTSSIPIRLVKMASAVCPNTYSINWPVTLLCECAVSMPSCWWNVLDAPSTTCKQDSSSFVQILGITTWTVECYEKLLYKFKVVVMYFWWSGNCPKLRKCGGDVRKQLPAFKEQFFSFSGKWRCGIASAEGMEEQERLGRNFSHFGSNFMDRNELQRFPCSKLDPQFI